MSRSILPFSIHAILIMVSMVAVGIAILYMWEVDRTGSPSDLDLKNIRIIQAYDDARFDVVHVETVFTIDRSVLISFDGDVVGTTVSLHHSDGWTSTHNSKGIVVHYSGLHQLNEPKAVGDKVTILIRHSGSTTEAVVEIEGL